MRVLRLDDLVRVAVGEAVPPAPELDLPPPPADRLGARLRPALLPERQHVGEHRADVADDRHLDVDVLVDRRGVDVDLHLVGAGREGVGAPGDPVVEPRADAEHEVAVVHRPVGLVGAVHPEHADPAAPGRGIGAEPHQRRGDRKAGAVGQLAQQPARLEPGVDDAATGIDHRPLSGRDHFRSAPELPRVAVNGGLIAPAKKPGSDTQNHTPPGRRLWEYRQGLALVGQRRDVEGFFDGPREVAHIADEVIVLCARARHTNDIGFLKGIIANNTSRDLPGKDDHGRRVHKGISQTGDDVRPTRTGSH